MKNCVINGMKCPNCDPATTKCRLSEEQHARVKAVCDDINHELNHRGSFAWLEPYLDSSSDLGDSEWKVRVVDPEGNEMCRHLQHSKLDWHTVKILLKARVEHGDLRFAAGKEHAVNKIAAHFKTIV